MGNAEPRAKHKFLALKQQSGGWMVVILSAILMCMKVHMNIKASHNAISHDVETCFDLLETVWDDSGFFFVFFKRQSLLAHL